MTQVWDNFAVITGSAAGALTGLLFVAVSLNRDRIAGHAALRSEAGQTLVLFLLALLLSVLLVMPGMSPRGFGIVLVAVAFTAGAALILIGRDKPRAPRPGPGAKDPTGTRDPTGAGHPTEATDPTGAVNRRRADERPGSGDRDGGRNRYGGGPEDQLARLLDTVSPNLAAVVCVTIAGCLQLAGGNGLYWLAAAVILAMGGGVVNAWLFLTR